MTKLSRAVPEHETSVRNSQTITAQSSSSPRVSHHSLRQRRELRGDVRPRQPPEWGHPAQLHQHVQRSQLLLRHPGHLRPIHHHIEPEHRGEPVAEGRHPVAAFRELIVLNCPQASALGALLPPWSLWHTEERDSLSASVWTALFLIYSWLSLFEFGPFFFFFFLSFVGNAFENANVFSGIDEDKRNRHFRCKM